MKFSKNMELPGSPAKVSAMLKNSRYYLKRWERLDPKANVDLHMDGLTLTVTSTLEIPAARVQTLSNFLDSGLSVKVLEIWSFNDSDLIQKAIFSASLAGVPVKGNLQITALSQNQSDTATKFSVTGEVNCAIPIIGTGVEKVVVLNVDHALREQISISKEFIQ